MASISKPDVTFNIVGSPTTAVDAPQRVLLFGQMLSAGTATPDTLILNLPAGGVEDRLFGAKSDLANMVRTFKRYNTVTQLDVVPLSDPTTGTPAAATATMTLTGTSGSAGGTLVFSIESKRWNTFSIAVAPAATAATVAASIVLAVNADPTCMVSASAVSNVVTLTCRHEGLIGNSFKTLISQNVSGLTVATSAFTGGTGAVDIPDLETLLGDYRHQTYVWPAYCSLPTILSFMEESFNVENGVMDGVAIICATHDTSANAIGVASSLHSKSIVYMADELRSDSDQKGGAIVEHNNSMGAYLAAVRSLRLTEGANIAQYVVGDDITDSYGGTYMAAVPYHETPFIDLPPIIQSRGWTKAEQKALNAGGVSFFGNNIAGNRIILGDMVTTYTENAEGIADPTFKYLNAVDTASAVREFMFNNCKQRYAQTVLTDGDITGPAKMANVSSITSFIIGLYGILAGNRYGLCQSGTAAFSYFKNNLQVTITSLALGTVNVVMSTPINGQLRGITGTIRIAFDITTN